jgi:RNA polymerase sigma factor (TIGR02999 family)
MAGMDSGMPQPSTAIREEATTCLTRWVHGDQAARSALFLVVLGELRSLARGLLVHERHGHTLQPTALVNEAWMRLIDWPKVEGRSKVEFLGVAAEAMREVLVDHARRRGRLKRGGDRERVELTEDPATGEANEEVDLLKLDRALDQLRRRSFYLAKLVELRFFGGLDRTATAEVLGVSDAKVGRDWRAAKAFLKLAMQEEDQPGS